MGAVYDPVEEPLVLRILKRRGYGINHTHEWRVQLTKKDPSRTRRDGRPEIILLQGVADEQMDVILRRHEDAEAAADEIEAIATGAQFGVKPVSERASAPALDTELIQQMIANRVGNFLADAKESLFRDLRTTLSAFVTAEVEQQIARVTAPRPRGRPKGSKNKPKVVDAVAVE